MIPEMMTVYSHLVNANVSQIFI